MSHFKIKLSLNFKFSHNDSSKNYTTAKHGLPHCSLVVLTLARYSSPVFKSAAVAGIPEGLGREDDANRLAAAS